MNNLFRYFSIAAILASSVCFVSCDIDPTTSTGGKDTVYFPIGNEIELHPLGDALNVSFTSDVDWYVEISPSNQDWMDISLKESRQNLYKKGTTKFQISAQAYKGTKTSLSNEAVIKFYSVDKEELHVVNVSQLAAYIDINQTFGSDGDFEWYADSSVKNRIYKISSNIHWDCDFLDSGIFSTDVTQGGSLKGDQRDMNIKAEDINIDMEPKATALVFRAIKKTNNEQDVIIDPEFVTLELQQDNLVFDVPSEFAPIGELGNYTFSYPTDYADLHWAEIEVLTETDYDTQWCMEGDAEFQSYQPEGNQWFKLTEVRGNGQLRTDRIKVEVESANPGTTARVAIVRFVSNLNDRAYRDVRIVQNPYTWEVSIGELSANQSGSTAIEIKTKGPWTIQKSSEPDWWWQSEETEWSGEGNKTIVINSTAWNLDVENSLTAEFGVSSGCNALAESLTLVKDRFHFDIGDNMVNDMETVREVLAELRKKNNTIYSVSVDCSGPWSFEFLEGEGLDKSWVTAYKESENEIMLGATSVNSSETDRNAVIVFTSLTHSEYGQELTYQLPMKQMRHVFGWEPDDWSEEEKSQNYYQPAYVGPGEVFGFATTFSDVWSLESDQSWLKFHLYGENPAQKISGMGESDNEKYVYVTIDNNFNTGSASRNATVKVTDLFTGIYKTFTVSQEPFVFDVTCQNKYSVGPFETDQKKFSIRVSENAPWTVTVTGNSSLLDGYTSGGTGTGTDMEFVFATKAVADVNTGNRTATVKIAVDGSNLSQTFTVEQPQYAFARSKDPSDFHEVDYKKQQIQIDCYDNQWSVKSSPSWIKAEKNGTYVDLIPNGVNTSLTAPNTGEIVISTPFNGAEKTMKFTVKQNNYNFVVSPSNLEFEPLEAVSAKKNIEIKSSAGWDYDAPADFIVSKGNGLLGVSVKAKNYKTSSVTNNLVITSEHEHKYTVSVVQKPYIFSVDEFQNTTVTNEEQTITFSNLKCTGQLTVKIDSKAASWLKVETQPTSGKLVLKVEANNAADRSATVELSSEHVANNSELTKKITITQNK